jgi:hypothetical protein
VLPDRISDPCLSTCDSTCAYSGLCGLSSLSVKDWQIKLLPVLVQENKCDCGCHTWLGTRVCYWTTENINRHHCRFLRAHGAWVGLASPAVRGEEDRDLTFEVGDGETGSGTTTGALPAASRPKAGLATGLVRWGWGWCDGVEDGGAGRGRRRGHCRWRRG